MPNIEQPSAQSFPLISVPQLRSRGWTDTLIQHHLAVHDETRPNPKYPNAGNRMKLYRLTRVEEAEASDAFQKALLRSNARKAAARKGVATKSEKMQDYLDNLTIAIDSIEKDTLIGLAKENSRSKLLPVEQDCVNYLRHVASKYEDELQNLYGKVGANDAYFDIKEMVLNAIAEKYDWLSDECDRQIEAAHKKQREREKQERF